MKSNGASGESREESGDVDGEGCEVRGSLMGSGGSGSSREEHCGLGSWQPKWARTLESTHVFMVVFLSGWVLQGVFYTYFVSVITTIEKLFRIKSKTTGTLLAATEVGQICTALLLTYFAGRGHRPRWIACGMILFALGCLGCALPHFILGGRLLESSLALRGGNLSSPAAAPLVCGDAPSRNTQTHCEESVLQEQAAHSHMTSIVLPIFFICLFAVGVGQTAICTLGIPYIDDNVASRESPLYIAITIGVRIVGPAGGFILGSFCTRVYADLTSPHGLQPTDPGWVGAWWLGLVLVSSLLFLMGVCMSCFPRQLPPPKGAPPRPPRSNKALPPPKGPQLKDFPKTLRRQLSNDILMFRTASCVLHLLPVAGLYTFLPKYLESQFRLPTHDANLISGIGGILVMGVGILLSGAVILKLVPTARFVAGWIAFTALAYASGMLILMFVGCPMDDLVGRPMDDLVGLPSDSLSPPPPSLSPSFSPGTHSSTLSPFFLSSPNPDCLDSCTCDRNKFGVVCGQDGRSYFSACHAGCHNASLVNEKLQYFNCACITRPENDSTQWDSWGLDARRGDKGGAARGGYCTGKCESFVLFICIFSFIMFIHATGEVGSILLIMRCTDPKDKAMAMGIIQFAIGLFGNVPCPIIFGIVVDSACLLWDSLCNTKGACILYDSDIFRQFFLGTTGGIMGLAFLVDLVVWYKAHKIDINPESDDEKEAAAAGPVGEVDLPTTPLTHPLPLTLPLDTTV